MIRGVIFNRLTTTLSRLNPWKGNTEPSVATDATEATDLKSSDEAAQKETSSSHNFSLSTVSFEPR